MQTDWFRRIVDAAGFWLHVHSSGSLCHVLCGDDFMGSFILSD